MNKRTTTLMLLAGLAAVFILSACGPKQTTLNITASDIKFNETAWEVPAGAEVTVNFKNEGALEHEFVIMKLGTQASMPFDENDEGNVYWEIEAEGGETVTGTFTAPAEPGVYEVVCGTAGHLESGMQGSLTVK